MQSVETVVIDGAHILAKRGMATVYANRTQAERAAATVGGVAFQSRSSARFLVEVPASALSSPVAA